MTLGELLKTNKDKKILAFGETHHGQHTAFFKELDNYIDQFNGVFLEMPVSNQSSVDYYVKNDNFDEKLGMLIEGARKEGKDIEETTRTIMNYGKKVPIVCIDSSKAKTQTYNNKSSNGYYFHKNNSRDEDMFESIVNRYKPDQKWILINGARHLEVGKHQTRSDSNLGTRLIEKFGDSLLRTCLIANQYSSEKVNNLTCEYVNEGTQGYLSQFDAYIITT